MAGRRLVFVNNADDVRDPHPSVDYCILDSAWSPPPDARPDLIPLRPAVWSAISTRNLHGESLAALDDWADRAGLNRRFEVRGVSWWYHARGFVRLDVHEMLLWRLVLEQVAPPGRYVRVDIPQDRPHLLAALEAPLLQANGEVAATPVVTVREPDTAARQYGGGKPSKLGGTTRPWYRRVVSGGLRRARRALPFRISKRSRQLERRFSRRSHQRTDVLAIVRAESFHVVEGPNGPQRMDPIITPVLDRLAVDRRAIDVVVRGSSGGVAEVEATAGVTALAYGTVAEILTGSGEGSETAAEFRQRVAGLEKVPLRAGGADFAPAMARILAGLHGWLNQQQRERLVAERLIDALRPRVLITGWESARTAWLAAARDHAIPSFAIQHGVIYRDNPDYYRPIRRGMIRPDLTCTFGDYERRLLVEECGYAERAVVATGSPRATKLFDTERDPEKVAAVRDQLGIAPGDRMLVISAARHAVGEELHGTVILANLLAGPMAGIHIVVKLHPEEQRGDHYLSLIDGLATAGGYVPPPVTIVREIDLYDLLRAADAHLGIYSTVLTDSVLAGTPNMIAVGHGWADLLDYVAAGVAHPVRSVVDVRAFMADPKPPTEEARAAFLADHYAEPDGAGRVAAAVGAYLRKVRAAA